jgi:hypothetical protein
MRPEELDMYIHSYQIHNVLNVYRKQLSQPAGSSKAKMHPAVAHEDRYSLTADGQRQSIFDKISAEIVDRFTRLDPTPQFDPLVKDNLSPESAPKQDADGLPKSEFSYNVIDEHNRKITNTLPLPRLNPFGRLPGSMNQSDGTRGQQTEKE